MRDAMLDAVLCELEGVLIDSAAPRREALVRALGEEGIAGALSPVAMASVGMLAPETALALLRRGGELVLDETGEELAALRAARYFSEALAGGGATLVPGAREAVDALAAAAPLALVTRARRGDVEQVLALADLGAHFAVVVTADEVRSPMPDPTMHRRALERLARRRPPRASHVAALESSDPGVRAALAAGVRPVRVGPDDVEVADTPVGNVAVPRLAHVAGLTPARLAALLALSPHPPR
jgi:beta-phosphoglucomutase-like phosphatase (HAD superfamily)